MSSLEIYIAEPLEHAQSWANLNPEALRRRAMTAANGRNAEELWSLTRAYLFLHGAKGGKVSKHTLKAYRRGVLDLLEHWQHENLIRPSRDAGVFYIRKLETQANPHSGKPLSPASIEVKLAAARTLYKAMRWANATETNPFGDVSPAPDGTPDWEKRRPYSAADIERLLKVSNPAETVMVLLGAHAGLRISEICGLKWSDINWKTGQLRVLGKGNKRASVSMSARLEQALIQLRALKDTRQRIKRSPDHILPWNTDRARQRFKQLCLLVGVDYQDKAVHGLRHGAGTRYYQQTKDLGRVAAHLRHENIQTTRIYAKLADEAIRDDIKDW